MQRVLLIIGGGIAAYKAPELVRRLRDHGLGVRCLLTSAAAQFVAPLSLASVSGDRVYENLFDLTDEAEMGHIQLSRDADLILVAPATAPATSAPSSSASPFVHDQNGGSGLLDHVLCFVGGLILGCVRR